MVIPFYCFSIIFGLCFGSFLNVVIYRLPRGICLARGRSFCPQCKHKISWSENIPLLSFLFLGGRCRRCHSPISWRYPLVELITGVVTLLVFSQFFPLGQGFGGQAIFGLICSLLLVWGLIAIFFIDLEHQIIPDKILFSLVALYLLFHLATGARLLLVNYLPAAVVCFLFFFLLFLVTRGRGMGFGDVKLAFLIGLALGFPEAIVAIYLAFLTGAILGIILVILKKVRFGQCIAFGPFLAAGAIIAFLWGDKISQFVISLLF